MAFYPVITGPVALYNNVPINAQFYEPSQFFISAITLGVSTTVTTTVNHNYVVGQLCRLLIPPIYQSLSNGVRIVVPTCTQLNEQTGYVTSIPTANSVVLNINSIGANAFVSSSQPTQPQIVAVGDVNSGLVNSLLTTNVNTYIPGSFINISPA